MEQDDLLTAELIRGQQNKPLFNGMTVQAFVTMMRQNAILSHASASHVSGAIILSRMSIKKVVIIAVAAFVVIVVLAIGLSARFSLSNIVDDPYAFIEKFFSQWSLTLSAAGTIILALSVFSFIYENRRREERENRQAIHALHDEILWNLNNVIILRFRISEYIRYIDEHNTTPSVPGPFELLETRVFDDMRSRGQLHLLEDLRMHILPGYKLIRDYNMDNHYKLHHLELLKNIHEGFERNIRALEAKFDFLPRYIKDRKDEEESKVENGDNRRDSEE